MEAKFKKGDVIQFNERHKWTGTLGIITEVKEVYTHDQTGEVDGKDIKYMVAIPKPVSGIEVATIYIYTMQDENEIEYIGRTHFELADKE